MLTTQIPEPFIWYFLLHKTEKIVHNIAHGIAQMLHHTYPHEEIAGDNQLRDVTSVSFASVHPILPVSHMMNTYECNRYSTTPFEHCFFCNWLVPASAMLKKTNTDCLNKVKLR